MAKYKPYEITVESVYGRPEPTIPYGFEDTGDFRPPQPGDEYLSTTGDRLVWTAIAASLEPRIILRKKKIKRIIYTQVRTGTPQPGEFYQSYAQDGTQMFRCVQAATQYPNVPIFKREEEEV